MHRLLLTGGLCLALSACATAPAQTLPSCNGQHRRPANPNGSVLLTPGVATAPAKTDAASFAPCGEPS